MNFVFTTRLWVSVYIVLFHIKIIYVVNFMRNGRLKKSEIVNKEGTTMILPEIIPSHILNCILKKDREKCRALILQVLKPIHFLELTSAVRLALLPKFSWRTALVLINGYCFWSRFFPNSYGQTPGLSFRHFYLLSDNSY